MNFITVVHFILPNVIIIHRIPVDKWKYQKKDFHDAKNNKENDRRK